MRQLMFMVMSGFQSTLPRMERPFSHSADPAIPYFNPRSREGSDTGLVAPDHSQIHFNPRSREGSDYLDSVCSRDYAISIHAPAKGATSAC